MWFHPLLIAAALLVLFQTYRVEADTASHKYKKDEHIELWVNKVGPYANPQEAYEYYKLPYCAPDTIHHPSKEDGRFNELKWHSLGERLSGHALRHSGHDVSFLRQKEETCTTSPLTPTEADLFVNAVRHRWFYQMYLDDLPVWGMVGEMLPSNQHPSPLDDKQKRNDLQRLESVSSGGGKSNDASSSSLTPYVYTTRHLKISYNENQIVKVDLTSDPKSLVAVQAGSQLTFALVTSFERTTTEEFRSRFDRYLDHEFFKHPIHWFSVFNSFMMVLFLMGLVALILLRTLKKDYARYGLLQENDEQQQEQELLVGDEEGGEQHYKGTTEDAGWKQVHGDVFRAPAMLPVFSALLGTGWQLVVLTLGVILFAVLGPLHGAVHEERGEVLHTIIICYSLSSIVAGFQSGKFFKLYSISSPAAATTTMRASSSSSSSTNMWQATMGLTVLLLPTCTVSIMTVLNAVSLYYGTIQTIPFMILVKLFVLWIFVTVPLCVVGTLLGRHTMQPKNPFPCRVNAIPRPIPEQVPWYGTPTGLVPLAGLLSFGSIFIELYYVLTSLWNYKFYHVYGFLLGVYGILAIVVSMTSIIVVYFLLNAENWTWQWTAFASGASTAGYVFAYGIYYYLFKTEMNGLLQTLFYFGYMALISIHLGVLCGTIGHAAASKFVRAIFQNVKVD
jgi:transmembrane 9 superfamily protein 3